MLRLIQTVAISKDVFTTVLILNFFFLTGTYVRFVHVCVHLILARVALKLACRIKLLAARITALAAPSSEVKANRYSDSYM
jgi:hypothetical protein